MIIAPTVLRLSILNDGNIGFWLGALSSSPSTAVLEVDTDDIESRCRRREGNKIEGDGDWERVADTVRVSEDVDWRP